MSGKINFDAMYFPYITIDNEEAIIRGILLFNKVYILAPKTKSVEEIIRLRPYRYRYYKSPYIDELEPIWFAGKKPRENLLKLCDSIDHDMGNEDFKRLIKRVEDKPYVYVHSEKFPLYILKKYQHCFTYLPARANMELKYTDINDDRLKESLCYLHDEWLLTRADLAYSLILNYTIMSMRTKQYCPFTESEKHSVVLESMLKNDFNFIQQYQGNSNKDFLKLLIPTLNGISIDRALEIRKENEIFFSKFHTNMARLIKIRRDELSQKGIDETSEEVYYSEIEPRLQELEIIYENTRKKLIAEIGGTIIAGTIALLAIPLIPVSASITGTSVAIAIKNKMALQEAKSKNFATYIYKIREEIKRDDQNKRVYGLQTRKKPSLSGDKKRRISRIFKRNIMQKKGTLSNEHISPHPSFCVSIYFSTTSNPCQTEP